MHWSEELGKWIEKTVGAVVVISLITVAVSIGLGLFIGLVMF